VTVRDQEKARNTFTCSQTAVTVCSPHLPGCVFNKGSSSCLSTHPNEPHQSPTSSPYLPFTAACLLLLLMSVDIRQALTSLRFPSRVESVSRSQLSRVHTGDSTRPAETKWSITFDKGITWLTSWLIAHCRQLYPSTAILISTERCYLNWRFLRVNTILFKWHISTAIVPFS